MSFFIDSNTFFDENFVSTENDDSVTQRFFGFDEDVSGSVKKYISIFSKIPFWHFMLLCLMIVILSSCLNLLVLLFYRKSNDVTRLYIVAYVYCSFVFYSFHSSVVCQLKRQFQSIYILNVIDFN